MIRTFFRKIFITKNERELKKYKKRVKSINNLEEKYKSLSDEKLKAEFEKLKALVLSKEKTLDEVLIPSFAITREASIRTLKMRHFDVQLIGGMALHEGKIAEMKTGEGKTLVATLAICLNAMEKKGVHLITVNDYLAKRDANELRPLYEFLGYKVGIIAEGMYDDKLKQEEYNCDISYGTNHEFGFDYLRDNMKYSLKEKVQRGHKFAIVDEVDSILIDEARTPLIISGPTNKILDNYIKADNVAKKLSKDKDFNIDEKNRVIIISEEGIKEAEKIFNVDNLYSIDNAILSHHLDQALKANYLFEKDVDYVIKNDEIMIVDEFTGRISEGRRFSEGLHQALEAKERVEIKEESQTLADITYQNYFRMYEKLAGMTGTAQTEATEFSQIYNLEVLSVPTNLAIQRKDLNDLIYKSEKEKFNAVILKIKELNKKEQPILIGTASIEKSELLHNLLKKAGIKHTVLNAKQHEQESEIIKNAGLKSAVTVATNMAGRGVDIKIDEEVKKLGGLYIIGTERHENRRIDNQLRGRAGRQGDPGLSQFYLSLEDTLLRIFGSDKIKTIMERLGVEEGEHIESKMVTRAVQKAQKKVEAMHFESRKHIVEYDDIANEQRKVIYKFRDELLNESFDINSKILELRKVYLKTLLDENEIYENSLKEDFNLEKLSLQMNEDLREKINIDELKDKEFKELEEYLYEKLNKLYDKKMSLIDDEFKNQIQREFYLKVLDNAWREHLYQMDTLKTGIGLRGYNQKDPLVEYKKESFHLFKELIQAIKLETIKTLHLIQFKEDFSKQEEENFKKLIEKEHQEANEALAYNQTIQKKKPTRNAPCPCGSGKKYKYCCGQSGPKVGKLAKGV